MSDDDGVLETTVSVARGNGMNMRLGWKSGSDDLKVEIFQDGRATTSVVLLSRYDVRRLQAVMDFWLKQTGYWGLGT